MLFRSDNLIDSSTAYLRTLGPGETWHMYNQLLATDAEPTSVEVEASFDAVPPSIPDSVEVVEDSLSGGDTNEVTSTAVIANNTGEELSYLEGISKFYESDGVVLTTGYKNINGLPAGDNWEIENTFRRSASPKVVSHDIVPTTSL
mgnify:FL=1